jgi:predicted transposase YbfD/YdcC
LIVATNNNYVVTIKRNYITLYNYAKKCSDNCENFKDRSFETTVKNHGRLEERNVHVFESKEKPIEIMEHVKSVVDVKRRRYDKKGYKNESIFYISNKDFSAKEFNKGIRNHWSIENNLHWVKDVVMREDSTLCNKKMTAIISILRSLIVTIGNRVCKSVTKFQRAYAHNISVLRKFIE